MTSRMQLTTAEHGLASHHERPRDAVIPVVRPRRSSVALSPRSTAQPGPVREGTDPASRGLAGATSAPTKPSREGRRE